MRDAPVSEHHHQNRADAYRDRSQHDQQGFWEIGQHLDTIFKRDRLYTLDNPLPISFFRFRFLFIHFAEGQLKRVENI